MGCPDFRKSVLGGDGVVPGRLTHDPDDFARVLGSARAGGPEELGLLLMECRNYLLLVADQRLGADLRGKVSPSDLVQETFLEAQKAFARFDGERQDELLAWLCCILVNNLANARRRYHGTDKRALEREVQFGDGRGAAGGGEAADTPSPSARAAAAEEVAALEAALARLPERYQQVIRLRYHEQMTFQQIGDATGCSAEAARKLWARAVDRLQKGMTPPGES
jgi:RNA polymerase sigma-70 factor (ECF subfamily)